MKYEVLLVLTAIARPWDRLWLVHLEKDGCQQRRRQENDHRVFLLGGRLWREEVQPGQSLQVKQSAACFENF